MNVHYSDELICRPTIRRLLMNKCSVLKKRERSKNLNTCFHFKLKDLFWNFIPVFEQPR